MTDMKPAEVAAILGVHLETVKSLLRSGQLRGFRVGRLWRVSPEALAEFRNEAIATERFTPMGESDKRPRGRPRKSETNENQASDQKEEERNG